MWVKMFLPALTEAVSPLLRPVKYSLFPPLGLATLAGYPSAAHEVSIHDEHVQRLDLDDGAGRLWQAASTVDAVLAPGLLEKAVEAGLRSIFVGFETVNGSNLAEQRKRQNIGRDYAAVVRRLHDNGVMVNASFVFGMDGDGPDVFDRTVEWAIANGVETATFHIMTPYPERLFSAGSKSRAGCCTGNGISTTPGTSSSNRTGSHPRNWRMATGVPTATSTDGARFGAGPRPRTRYAAVSGTLRIRPGGRSSSRCGTRSSGVARCCELGRCSSQCCQ